MKKKVLHLHIPKSAGSTFNKCLGYYFPGKVHRIKGHFNYSYPIVDFGDAPAITGHFDMRSVTERFEDPAKVQVVCFVRNPIERVVSGYYNVKRDVTNPMHHAVKNMDLLTYIESDLVPDASNGQVRRLSSLGARKDEQHVVTAQHLDEAFDLIERYAIRIGISEAFETSLLQMARDLNWQTPRYISVNKSKNKKQKHDVDHYQQAYQAIVKKNTYDLALYQYFKNLHLLQKPVSRMATLQFRFLNKLFFLSKVPDMVRFKLQSRGAKK